MSKNRRIILVTLIVSFVASLTGCIERNPNATPDQFDPPPGVYPDQVGKMVLERKWDKNPGCIRNGPVTCIGFYIDPADDPDGTRIYQSVDIFETPAEAVAQLEEAAGRKVMDEDTFAWENLRNKNGKDLGRLLVRSGFRSDGEGLIGSCSMKYTDGSMLIDIASGFSCDPAREFLNNLVANR